MKDRTRKICSVLLTLTLFVGILLPMGAAPAQAQAMSTNPAGFAYEVNGDGTIEITRLPNDCFNTGIADIPATIDGQKVTALDKDLFVSGLSEVTVPGTVAAIPDYLFRLDNQGSDGLKKVVLKDGVKKIGRESFAFQVGLSSVTLSNELTEIGGSAFQGCTALARIDLPSSLTTIGGSAFMSSGLTAVVLPDTVREVGAQAFRNCSKLQSVTLSSGMTTISARLFENADKLTTVTIPANIQSIREDAFNGCDGLKTIYFGGTQAQWNELTSYPNMASQGNEILKNVKVIFANGESSDPSTPTEPEDTAIPVPVDLTAESTVDGVQLNWSIPLSDPWSDWVYDGFIIYRENASGGFTEIDRSSVMTYVDKDVKDGGSYTYWLCAYDGSATGDYSETVTITYDANPFTTTTIRDTAIRIGNQEDGSTNFTGVDKLWLTTGTQGMRIDLIFPEEMDELKDQQLSVTVSGGGQTFQGTAVEYIGQQVSFTLALTGGKHLKPDTTYTVAVKDARGNTIAQTTLQSAGEETASWGFTNKDASYGFADLCRYYPASVALALSSLDKSHGEDGLCFGMALANAAVEAGQNADDLRWPRVAQYCELERHPCQRSLAGSAHRGLHQGLQHSAVQS